MGVGCWKPERAALSSGGIGSLSKERMGSIEGPPFAAVRMMEFDCRYPSISEGSVAGLEAEEKLVDGPNVASGSGSSTSLRLFSFLGGLSSDVPSRLLLFFLRSGCSEAGSPAKMSLTQPNDKAGSAHR